MKLRPLTPQTEEEKIEHSIAAERRRMRLVHKDTLKDLLTRSPRETGTVSCGLGFRPQNSPTGDTLLPWRAAGGEGGGCHGGGSAPLPHTPKLGGAGGLVPGGWL